jgi:hypothetical protein
VRPIDESRVLLIIGGVLIAASALADWLLPVGPHPFPYDGPSQLPLDGCLCSPLEAGWSYLPIALGLAPISIALLGHRSHARFLALIVAGAVTLLVSFVVSQLINVTPSIGGSVVAQPHPAGPLLALAGAAFLLHARRLATPPRSEASRLADTPAESQGDPALIPQRRDSAEGPEGPSALATPEELVRAH